MMAEEVRLPSKDVSSLSLQDELASILYYPLLPHYTALRESSTEGRPAKVWEVVHKINSALMSVYTPQILYTLHNLKVVWKSKLYRLIGGHKQALFNAISNLHASNIIQLVDKDEEEATTALRMERSDMDRGAFFNESRVNDCFTINPSLLSFVELYLNDVAEDIPVSLKKKVECGSRKLGMVKRQLGVAQCTNCGTSNPRTMNTKTMLCLDCMLAGVKPQ